jgi:hypothetical protein
METNEPIEKLKQKSKELKSDGERAARKAASHPWMGALTRLGYGVRGTLYLLMGLLAIQVALGVRGTAEDQHGAIAAIAAQPFGQVVLVVIAAGLAGFALWSLFRALLGPNRNGVRVEGALHRLGHLATAITYTALSVYAIRMITGPVSAGEVEAADPQKVSASLLALPWGPWAVGIIGLVAVLVGAAQVYKGWRGNFDDQLDHYELSQNQIRRVEQLGRLGYTARGAVFALVGLFFIQAAVYADPGKVKDMDGALQALSWQPFGPLYLGTIALGLIAFGAYSLIGAAWFRLKLP